MASITPLGGPSSRRYRYTELRDAVAADLSEAIEAAEALGL